MKYKNLLFDLDGTLTDSREGITNSIQYALDKLGGPKEEKETLLKYIGPPLSETFKDYFDDLETQKKAVLTYRERYEDYGWKENRVYEGVHEMLKALKDAGYKIFMGTSKPKKYAGYIADYFEFSQYFDEIFGASLDGKINTKEQVLAYALDHIYSGSYDEQENKDVLMIGDRFYDVCGAAEFGIPTLGVSYGFGSEEELRANGALDVVDSPKAVVDWLGNC